MRNTFLILCGLGSLTGSVFGQSAYLGEGCTVSLLNRTVQVQQDGTWINPTVPAGLGPVRARVVCVVNGTTKTGESPLIDIPPNGNVNFPDIPLGGSTPIPDLVKISAPSTQLTQSAPTTQLTVTASFPDNTSGDVTNAAGTAFYSSNPAIATVTPSGLVTAKSSGTAIILAANEGTGAFFQIKVSFSGDTDADGLPDDWEISHGLNPNDPSDAAADPDRDGLTNLDEYRLGTDPHNPDTDGDGLKDGEEVIRGTNPLLADTDGDGIPDGLEVKLGTNPLDPKSGNLADAIDHIDVTPPAATLIVNTLSPEASVQLRASAVLKDGSRLEVTSSGRGTHYSSSDLTICNFSSTEGQIFAGNAGTCVVTVTNGAFSSQVPIRVENFSPVRLSSLAIPNSAAVEIKGPTAYVVGGSTLTVVDVADRSAPKIVGTAISSNGSMTDVRVAGNYAYAAAGDAGLAVFDISNRTHPNFVRLVDTPGNASDIAIAGGTLYLADGSNGLIIFDLADPTTPAPVSTTPLAAPILGVAVDPIRNLAVAALGGSGLQIVDVTSSFRPVIRGSLAGGAVNDVVIKDNVALLADETRSVTSVDIGNPDRPVLLNSTRGDLGGVPADLAYSGEYLSTADITFGAAYPVISVSDPSLPVPRFFLDVTPRGYGTGIAIDSSFTYLIAGSYLQISQYRSLTDNNGIPPTAKIVDPAPGATVIARTIVPVTVQASDDVAVAIVQLLVNGQVVGSVAGESGIVSLSIPKDIESITIQARAIDLGGNVGLSTPVTYDVIVGLLTTVTGTGMDRNNNVISNARVNVVNEFYSQSTADGTFSISSVPAALARIRAYGEVAVAGVVLRGRSSFARTVAGGITNVGSMLYFPDADWDGLPDDYEAANACLNANSADDDADPDGDSLTNFDEYLLGTDPCRPNLPPGQTTVVSSLVSVQNGSFALPGMGENQAVSGLLSVSNGGSGVVLPTGFNEVVSALLSTRNDGDTIGLPGGFNEAVSALLSARNGSDVGGLPAGFNEVVSALLSARNGSGDISSLPAGFNEAATPLLSLRNGVVADPQSGYSSAVSSLVSIGNGAAGSNSSPVLNFTLANTIGKNNAPVMNAALAEGQTVIAGETVRLHYDAAATTASVDFLLDGTLLATLKEPPFQSAFVMPEGVNSLQVRLIVHQVDESVTAIDQWVKVQNPTNRAVSLTLADETGAPLANRSVRVFTPGLTAEYFDSKVPLSSLPDLTDRQPDRTASVSSLTFQNPDGIFGPDPFGSRFSPDFAIRFSGYLQVSEPAEYRLHIRSQEGARLELDGAALLTVAGGATPREGDAVVNLKPGLHPISLSYYATVGAPELTLSMAAGNQPLRPLDEMRLWHSQEIRSGAQGQVVLPALPAWVKALQFVMEESADLVYSSALVDLTGTAPSAVVVRKLGIQ